ncbi:MAG: (Fe-S)-binding protein [Armatimonadota bacterium]
MGNEKLFAVVLAISLITFVASCIIRFRLTALGKKDNRIDQPARRFWHMLVYAFGQKRVATSRYKFGFNHLLIFWSFLVLLIANAEFVIAGVTGGKISLGLLPGPAHYALSVLFDLVSLLTLVVILIAMGRRLFAPPKYIEARSRDAFIILSMIAGLMIAYFVSHAADIAGVMQDIARTSVQQEPGVAVVTTLHVGPISGILASLMRSAPAETLSMLALVFWWLHAVVLLAFLNYLPYSKHMHILTAIPNCFLRSFDKVNTLPREEFTSGKTFGVGAVNDFTWKDLFDSYSCTECGRCQDVCPAANTGKPLSPKDVVHDIKMNLLENGPRLQQGQPAACPLIGEGEGSVSEEALWACTSCGACMEVCPVFIEQMPKILQMRRSLVEEHAKFPEELLNLFENMEQRSNPWGIAPAERTKWTAELDVKPFSAEMEYLFYVGCAGAFDSRSKQVTLAMAQILDEAGVSWGILGRDEKCCGDSLRRLGNEYVFDRMAQENVTLFKERGVKKIITQCPHCFSTLKNDYRQYGLEVEVLHHSEVIEQLITSGKLKVKPGADFGNVVFHDSCYLGRHNDVYDAPRAVATAATGKAPAEMERSRNNAFCCGAGGGRMWMEENTGTRINLERVKEALREQPDTVCVSCPYCLTMFEDGLKDEGADEKVHVRDIAEMVAAALPADKKTPV